MEKNIYITDEEYEKCRNIADIFSTLEEDDIVLLDLGRYGFAALLYYQSPHGFEAVKTFTDSRRMFDFLWMEWLDSQLIRIAKAMNLNDLDYDDVFKRLPEKKQNELMGTREIFLEKAGGI